MEGLTRPARRAAVARLAAVPTQACPSRIEYPVYSAPSRRRDDRLQDRSSRTLARARGLQLTATPLAHALMALLRPCLICN